MPRVLLASASERRRSLIEEFLKDIGLEVEFCVLEEEEIEASSSTEVSLQVENSCISKAKAAVNERGILEENSPYTIVVSDTLVEDPEDTRVALGKPKDKVGAAYSLVRLSGRRHRVWSSTAILDRERGEFEVGHGWHCTVWTDFSIVEFEELEQDDILELINSNSWLGKAGGYDWAGMAGQYVKIIEGAELTVLGFSERAFNSLEGFLSKRM